MKNFIIGLAVLFPALASACFEDLGGYGGYGMMGYNGGMGGFGLLAIMMFSVWLVVGILACVWLWQHVNKK